MGYFHHGRRLLGKVDSASASSSHVNSVACPFSFVVHVISIIASRSIASDAVNVFPSEGVAGFAEAKDAVDEQHDHIDESQQEKVPFFWY